MEVDIKRWTAKRKTALILDIIKGKAQPIEADPCKDTRTIPEVSARNPSDLLLRETARSIHIENYEKH